MTASSMTATSSTGLSSRPEFWEFLWRSAGLQAVGLLIIATFLQVAPPPASAGPEALQAFYDANGLRLLISASLTGLAILNLLWFAASVRTTLADVGKDGWGAAVTASSAAFGGLFLLVTALGVIPALQHTSTAGQAVGPGTNDLSSPLLVLLSFPRAMLIMSIAFGLWRAKLISNAFFALGVAFVILGVLGGTTWASEGFWSPNGAFAHSVSPNLLLVWIILVSAVLFVRRPTARSGW